MFVSEILKRKGGDVVTTSPETPVRDVAKLFRTNRIGLAVVCDEAGEMVGVISERDIIYGIAEEGGKAADHKVEEMMDREIITCKSDDMIQKAMSVMLARRLRHLPVLDEGVLKGLISIGDVLKYRLEETMLDEKAMRDYISGRLY